jgi:hypothetical protein
VSSACEDGATPSGAGLVLTTLILVAGVANLNLSVANVALPSIGAHFDSSQTALDLVAVGYSLGLALTAGYASAASAIIASSGTQVSDSVANQLTKSFDGAEAIAQQYPQYASQITAAAKTSFLQGDQWAYLAGISAVLAGAAIVAVFFPRFEREKEVLAAYQVENVRGSDPSTTGAQAAPMSPA